MLSYVILSCQFILHNSLLSNFHLHYLWHLRELLALVDIDTPLRVPLSPPHVVLSCQTTKQQEGREQHQNYENNNEDKKIIM